MKKTLPIIILLIIAAVIISLILMFTFQKTAIAPTNESQEATPEVDVTEPATGEEINDVNNDINDNPEVTSEVPAEETQTTPPAGTSTAQELADRIRLTTPTADQIVTSPLAITGSARGTWYFEASFPVKLYTSAGQIIAQGIAQAQSDWMTENFVPFKAELSFTAPTAGSGYLVLVKDNPSDMRQYDAALAVPVKFNNSASLKTVKIFFGNNVQNPGAEDCTLVYPVTRSIATTPAVGTAAIQELLTGPTEAEKSQGYFTSLNSGVVLQKLTIVDGIAKADFSKKLDEAVGGSCRVASIASQIRQTLLQFPSVKTVVISIDGRSEDILQP
ncbi:MAG: hypothetical protein A2445_03755 [Candidatus Jacksonbacteria bacterium RIFOXYC2_FULL_44_29]|nr:MAG: hypothetical protein UW45_C0040G0004 [Parcubacteria group bacterium GW2011_GWC2_44_22]OGY74562.1 MAG: hypothetical protein A2240_02525 [Candidatus Jacksonbacteria bacterium RIFOXYA2_FULL_43_12]OGY77263.1 MAG: hypothetical protein A2445_03755 [Candidatus Jacksonbacteria bacterium RIFOXYC2_FULL_44_29]OGY77809.1 MAG: hypothetical protein A2295_04390 [Candidatus Jacksonbacteria bacterium RIFOXYB2_FULL_44_15]OGY78293.1 MAG: hypothetical protein A2550_03750 [Candidatus Jacksonbacteria bacteri